MDSFLLPRPRGSDTTVREIREGKTASCANVPETREKLCSAKLTIGGDCAYLALDRDDISRILSLSVATIHGPVAMTTGDAVASWYRHSIALPSSSRLVLLPSPPLQSTANPHQRSLRTSLSTSTSTGTHTSISSVCRGPCPQDIPRDAREFAG